MKTIFIKRTLLCAISMFVLGACTQAVQATSRQRPQPLSERVKLADTVFLGKLKNRVVKGDWVTAELHVEKALIHAELAQVFKVTWRSNSKMIVFDVKEGARGIALLKDKYEGRYWLRSDRFEDVKKLAEVQKMIAK